MEKFDLKRFNENKIEGRFEFILDDGTQVSQWENIPHSYIERSKKPNSRFETVKEYDHSTLHLTRSGDEFYGFPVGKWKTYTSKGLLIEEKNMDEGFSFSVYDLAKKMNSFKVDILSSQPGPSVSRSIQFGPQYIVSFIPDTSKSDERKVLVIDGVSGETTTEKVHIRTK